MCSTISLHIAASSYRAECFEYLIEHTLFVVLSVEYSSGRENAHSCVIVSSEGYFTSLSRLDNKRKELTCATNSERFQKHSEKGNWSALWKFDAPRPSRHLCGFLLWAVRWMACYGGAELAPFPRKQPSEGVHEHPFTRQYFFPKRQAHAFGRKNQMAAANRCFRRCTINQNLPAQRTEKMKRWVRVRHLQCDDFFFRFDDILTNILHRH